MTAKNCKSFGLLTLKIFNLKHKIRLSYIILK